MKEKQLYEKKEKNINTIIAINNIKIINEIKKINEIKIINSDIQYKEGIIEILEKKQNIDLIILNENIPGNINLINLTNQINRINKKIKIIILIINTNEKKEEILNRKNIEYIKIKKINSKIIKEKIKLLNTKKENKKIIINGNRGSGKTFFSIIITELLIKKFGKKVLIIDGDEWNNSITKAYLLNKKINSINFINKSLDIMNIKECKKIGINIYKQIKKIEKKYDYVIYDFNRKIFYKKINFEFYIIENNLLELNKIANKIKNEKEIKIILNKYNKNLISKNVLKKFLKSQKIIEEINYISNFNLIVNKNVNIKFLNKRIKQKFINIIKKEILI